MGKPRKGETREQFNRRRRERYRNIRNIPRIREQYLIYRRRYYENHKEQMQKSARAYQKRIRMRAIERLGGKCVICGFDDVRALQIDHIKGGGNAEARAKYRAGIFRIVGTAELSYVKEHYQLLCANCNWIKRFENKEMNQHTHPLKSE